MCGRLVINLSPETITEIYGIVRKIDRELNNRYNVAPTQDIPIVRQAGDGARELAFVRWGLIPSWSKDPAIGNSLINARAETVAEKPSFRSAFRRHRCLVVSSGFYEWQKLPDGRKQPYYIHPNDGAPLTLAGLWEHWQSPEGNVIESCTIITTGANQAMTTIHDRMPVILSKQVYDLWLDERTPRDELTGLLVPADNDALTMVPVSTMVNSPRNSGPECIMPVVA